MRARSLQEVGEDAAGVGGRLLSTKQGAPKAEPTIVEPIKRAAWHTSQNRVQQQRNGTSNTKGEHTARHCHARGSVARCGKERVAQGTCGKSSKDTRRTTTGRSQP